jgi:hypothetical protein
MMALMSDALETCVRVLETCMPSCTGRLARLFFMLEIRGHMGPQDAWRPGDLPEERQDPEP